MHRDDGILGFVLDELRGWGAVTTRRMFGAVGLFRGGVMFGFVADETLHLKVGDANRAAFEAADSHPFVYTGKGKPVEMSYWTAPAAALDDSDELRRFVQGAYAVAFEANQRGSRGVEAKTAPKRRAKIRRTRESGGKKSSS